MKKLLRFLLIVFVMLLSASVMVGLFLPTEYSVARSLTINAQPKQIHNYTGDLEKWRLWEPWRDGDPSIVVNHGEKTTGVGASQSWSGRDGKGSLVFTASDPAKGIEYDLLFEEGAWKSKASLTYSRLNSTQSVVTWKMWGSADIPIIGGYFALLMDRMVGPMFAAGLEKLKRVVEQGDKAGSNGNLGQ